MAEIFDLENTPKLLKGPKQHLFDISLRNSILINSARISLIDLIYESFWISLWSSDLFSCGIYIVNMKDSKIMF